MSESRDRIIGQYDKGDEGPMVVFFGGIHGNEPSGVYALQRVFATLRELSPPFRGRVVGIKGNLESLRRQMRFVDQDLNRMWSAEEIARVESLPTAGRNVEERELVELVDHLRHFFSHEKQKRVFVDFHTTSAPGGLFSVVSGNGHNRELASALHAPVVFKLTNELSYTTNVYLDNNGLTGIAFEGGQHENPESVDIHEAAVWLLLEKAGCIDASEISLLEEYHRRLIAASRFLPHYVEVVYRHVIQPGDGFYMHYGFSSFHEVYKGEPIAKDNKGDVICPQSGLLLMPLYQDQGAEGFFIVKKADEPPI